MTAGLALVAAVQLIVIVLLLVECSVLRFENATQDSLLAALRASHDEIQDVALKALRGDLERRADR